MIVKTDYEGQEVWVDERIKVLLDKLKKEEIAQDKKRQRHELLWDSMLIEGIDGNEKVVSTEDGAINSIYFKEIGKLVKELENLDKSLIIDRYFYEMKLSEMAEKYCMPNSTIDSRIRRAIDKLKSNLI